MATVTQISKSEPETKALVRMPVAENGMMHVKVMACNSEEVLATGTPSILLN